jgi:hypothetical protein
MQTVKMFKENFMFTFGQHLEVARTFYNHHGIYIGNNQVVHYSSPPSAKSDGVGIEQILGADSLVNAIHIAEVKSFSLDGSPLAVTYDRDNVYPPMKIVARALSRVDENGYNLWGNNCEHFARWCTIAESESLQINFIKKTFNTLVAGTVGVAKGAATGHGSAVGLAKLATMAGVTGGAILVSPVTITAGAVTGIYLAFKAWFSKKNIKLLPVYREFVEYSTELYFASKYKHPLGRSFIHSSQFQDKKEFSIPQGSGDKLVLFSYEGSWLFGKNNDWFITERAIHYPTKDIVINFHEVQDISSNFGKLTIVKTDSEVIELPSKFINANSVAKFLAASVAVLPLKEEDLKVPFLSRVKDFTKMIVGGFIIAFIVNFFSENVASWAFLIAMIVGFCQLFPFFDKKKDL